LHTKYELFASQGICDGNQVAVAHISTYLICDVGRLGGAWFILESFEVGSDIVAVDLDLDLAGKSNVDWWRAWGEMRVHTTIEQQTQSAVICKTPHSILFQSQGRINRITILWELFVVIVSSILRSSENGDPYREGSRMVRHYQELHKRDSV
jgi:hypothetical protein